MSNEWSVVSTQHGYRMSRDRENQHESVTAVIQPIEDDSNSSNCPIPLKVIRGGNKHQYLGLARGMQTFKTRKTLTRLATVAATGAILDVMLGLPLTSIIRPVVVSAATMSMAPNVINVPAGGSIDANSIGQMATGVIHSHDPYVVVNTAAQPLVGIMQALESPIAKISMGLAAILMMVGNVRKGMERIRYVIIGIVAFEVGPVTVDILHRALSSVIV